MTITDRFGNSVSQTFKVKPIDVTSPEDNIATEEAARKVNRIDPGNVSFVVGRDDYKIVAFIDAKKGDRIVLEPDITGYDLYNYYW